MSDGGRMGLARRVALGGRGTVCAVYNVLTVKPEGETSRPSISTVR